MSDTLRIILGYILFFGYIGLVSVVGETVQKKFDLDKDMTRKVEHIFAGVCWIIAYLFFGWSIHHFIVNVIGLILLTVITFGGLLKTIERTDLGKSYGVFYFGLSTLVVASIVIFIENDLFLYYGIAYYCLVLADGLAPIVAKAFKKHNLALVNGKSLVGTLTVFAVTALVAFIFSLIFSMHLSVMLILSLASVVAMAELFGAKGTDNLTILFCAFGYLTLAHYGYLDLGTMILIFLVPVLTISSIRSGTLTPSAHAVSYLFLLLYAIFGGYYFVTFVILLFVVAAVVAKYTARSFAARTHTQEKHIRGTVQIIANGLIAALFTTLWFFLQARWLLLVAFTVIIEEFADSMSSDFGRLSKRQPVDILRFRRVPAGRSGGVSLLGTSASLLASFLAGLSVLLLYHDPILYVTISGIAFLGTIADSILGSSIQGLFECPVCGAVTEKRTHCGTKGKCIKGLYAVDNSLVNFLSGALTAAIAAAVLLVTQIA